MTTYVATTPGATADAPEVIADAPEVTAEATEAAEAVTTVPVECSSLKLRQGGDLSIQLDIVTATPEAA